MSWEKKLVELVDGGKREFTYSDEMEICDEYNVLVHRGYLDKKSDIIGNIKLTLNEKAYNKYDELINPPPSSGANINIGQMSGGNVAGQDLTDNSINNVATTDVGYIISEINNNTTLSQPEKDKVTSLVSELGEAKDKQSIFDIFSEFLETIPGVGKTAAWAIKQLSKKRF